MNSQQDQDSAAQRGDSCNRFEPLLILSAAGNELDAAEKADLAEHLTSCAACSAALARERSLLSLLAEQRIEADAALLGGCRASLEDALDREEERGWLGRIFAGVIPAGWTSPRPAWSAALLILTGFAVGAFGPRLLQHRMPVQPSAPQPLAAADAPPVTQEQAPEVNSLPSPDSPLGALDLHTADVAGISILPSAADGIPQVQLRLKAQQPVTVQGTVNSTDVKRVLLYVLQHNQRFDPDVRLDAVDLLCARKNDPEVRSALCRAVRTDHNAAVRLKALEGLNGAEPQAMIRETMLDALVDDQNPGVRVEAINAIRQMAARGECPTQGRVATVLRNRMEKDPNAYIRMQSAAAIRDLGSHPNF